MHRRSFFKISAFAGISLPGFLAVACGRSRAENPGDSVSLPAPFELEETTIEALQQKMQTGALSSRKITSLYLERIAAIDQAGPMLKSVIELNPDALAIADALDEERKSGRVRGPLHGIPILIKDNIDTADKMSTTAGSLALEGHHAAQDAFIVERLRAAGAVLLGKTNLSEWANFRSTRSCSGWSSRGGQTHNPCVLDRNPCGSSSGSGVAVAANLCAVAVGTETDGSVIAPASFCGIVGIKPTVGLCSRSGIIPISQTQDTAGPMARSVRDAAVLLGVLAGIDPKDAVTEGGKGKLYPDYTTFLDANALQGKRIGVEKQSLSGHEGVVALFKAAVEVLTKQGATIVEVELLKQYENQGDAEFDVLLYEFKDGLNRYLSTANARVKSLADVIAFNNAHADTAMPFFKQELLEMSQSKGDLNSAEYRAALKKSLESRSIIDAMLQKHQLDAICGVSIGLPHTIDLVNGDTNTGFYFCPPAATAGYPHITVPMGRVHELPAGLSFMSGAYKEPELLALAYAYEQATKHRKAPAFLKTAG